MNYLKSCKSYLERGLHNKEGPKICGYHGLLRALENVLCITITPYYLSNKHYKSCYNVTLSVIWQFLTFSRNYHLRKSDKFAFLAVQPLTGTNHPTKKDTSNASNINIYMCMRYSGMKNIPLLPSVFVHSSHRALDQLFRFQMGNKQGATILLNNLWTDKEAERNVSPEKITQFHQM